MYQNYILKKILKRFKDFLFFSIFFNHHIQSLPFYGAFYDSFQRRFCKNKFRRYFIDKKPFGQTSNM